MIPEPANPEPAQSSPPQSSPQQDDRLYYRDILHELIELGTDLARDVHRRAKAAPDDASTDPTIAFDRIARAVRRTILLAQAVMAPVAVPAEPRPQPDRTVARKRIIRAVEDAIQRETEDVESDMLHAEFHERLDTEDFKHDLEHHSVTDLIADICRDLGIAHMHGTHPWKRRTPEDLAALHQRAATPSPAPGAPIPLHPPRFRGK